MTIRWKLKTFVANRQGIYGSVALQKLIVKKTGVLISLQNICNYYEKKPKMLRLATLEVFCTALECTLADLIQIEPNPKFQNPKEVKKLAYQNTPISKRSAKHFPDPTHYKSSL